MESRRRPGRVGRIIVAALTCLALACERSPVLYTDATASSGVDFRVETGAAGDRHIFETMAGGLGFLDLEGDGDMDLYLVNGHSDPRHADEPGKEMDRLYRNDGSGRFTDATVEAGAGDRRYGLGIACGDADGDGDTDVLVTNFGRCTYLRNEGGKLGDATEAAGIVKTGFHTSAAWFDMDRDGDLDLYVARYLVYRPASARRCREGSVPVYCSPKLFPGEPDLLYRNLGGGVFEEIGERAGIARGGEDEGKGLGVVVFDVDGDGAQDIFVANDTTPNFLWRSNGDGTYTDIAHAAGVAVSGEGKAQAGMGVDVADVNGDGLLDLHVTNFSQELNSLYLGQAGGSFLDGSRAANLVSTYLPLGFGTLFVDADLDGDQDIVNANGHVNDRVEETDPGTGSTHAQRPALYLNDGKGRFEQAAPSLAGTPFSAACVGRGLARADIDGDGDIDLAISSLDGPVRILRNESAGRARSLTVKLVGRRSPRDGSGARVTAETRGPEGLRRQTLECSSARSYLSASDPRIVIGLGDAPVVERLTVRWPSGAVTQRRDLAPPGPVVIQEE
jgi:hypothetical protein